MKCRMNAGKSGSFVSVLLLVCLAACQAASNAAPSTKEDTEPPELTSPTMTSAVEPARTSTPMLTATPPTGSHDSCHFSG
jgi:hypothetical protein